jgi:hypothetical protein
VLPNTLPLDTTPPPPAAAAARRPRPCTDSVREAGRPCTAAPAAVRRPLHRHSPLPAQIHTAHRRQGGQGVYPQTQTLYGSYSAARVTPGPGPSARRCLLPGFPAAGGRGSPPGTLRPTASSRTAPRTVFPWHAARGFCTPRRRSRPRSYVFLCFPTATRQAKYMYSTLLVFSLFGRAVYASATSSTFLLTRSLVQYLHAKKK